MTRWIVYGSPHPASVTVIIGRYRFRIIAWLAAKRFEFWTNSGDEHFWSSTEPFAHAWIVEDLRLPTARVHRLRDGT